MARHDLERHTFDRKAFALLAGLLLIAFAFGGGGIGAALGNLAVQLAALAVLAASGTSATQFWHESPAPMRWLIAATLALPLLQLVPLPESVWSNLPNRDLVTRSLGAAGGGGWRPFSVDPLRTLLAFTALITPIAVLLAGWTLPRPSLMLSCWTIVALGIVTVLLGALQLGGTTQAGTLYGSRAPGELLLGTFANRNSTGLFLTFAMGLAALVPAPRPHPAVLPIRLALVAVLLLGVVLTQSRTALVLALIPLGLAILKVIAGTMQAGWPRLLSRAVIAAFAALAVLGVGASAIGLAAPDRISSTLQRFEARDDPRRFIWDDASYSAGQYWPLGAGMGTFDEIYAVDESLENLTLRRAGRAHNDYIELMIEAGAAGLALAAMWMALVGWLSWLARQSSQRWTAWACSGFLLAIALQGITDYPLRNQTMLAVAGFALLVLTRIAGNHNHGAKR